MAPINLAISISERCVKICKRMVLKVMATSANASSVLITTINSLTKASTASSRLAHAESNCTCSTLGHAAISARMRSCVAASCPRASTTKPSGSGLRGRLAMTSARPERAFNSSSALSRETKRCALTPDNFFNRSSMARTSAGCASSSMNTLNCGAGVCSRATPCTLTSTT